MESIVWKMWKKQGKSKGYLKKGAIKFPIAKSEQMFYNTNIAKSERMFAMGDRYMDYKKQIIELLDKTDDRKLRLILCYIKALLGLR